MRRPLSLLHLLLILVLYPLQLPAATCEEEFLPFSRYLDREILTVVVSFDGSGDLPRWQEILDFGEREEVPMTFFVSGVYFLTDGERDRYLNPADPVRRGESQIGFGGDEEMVAKRKALVARALQGGNDIESHLNGHFDGGRWPESVWRREFAAFDALMDFLPGRVEHIRFPLLAMNDAVYPAMADFGVKTITSITAKDPSLFRRVTLQHNGAPYTILEFPISIRHEGKGRFILMDYNLFLNDQNHHRRGPAATAKTVDLYLSEAERCLQEGRPLFLSHHFAPLNDDAYWPALQQTIPQLKARYRVRFVTISGLYALLRQRESSLAGG